MNGFQKAECSNTWIPICRNKKNFKKPISKYFFLEVVLSRSICSIEFNCYVSKEVGKFKTKNLQQTPSRSMHLFFLFLRSFDFGGGGFLIFILQKLKE